MKAPLTKSKCNMSWKRKPLQEKLNMIHEKNSIVKCTVCLNV